MTHVKTNDIIKLSIKSVNWFAMGYRLFFSGNK